jgi:hypothetical protein
MREATTRERRRKEIEALKTATTFLLLRRMIASPNSMCETRKRLVVVAVTSVDHSPSYKAKESCAAGRGMEMEGERDVHTDRRLDSIFER